MATLTFSSWQYFNLSGSTMTAQTYGTDASTVTENTVIDDYMRPGETFQDNWGGGGATYHGLYDHGGTIFMVMEDVNFGYFLAPAPAHGDLPESAFPDTWDFNNLQDSASDIVFMCFAEGTLIAGPDGEIPVENLQAGDRILSEAGEIIEVKWIGRKTVSTAFGTADRLCPVRLSAGALGNGLPHSQLTVTADHALLVDGFLCNAAALVNGTTIARVPLNDLGERFTVYHVETEAHEIILANGAPAETFIDHASRRAFDNFAEYEASFGDEPEMQELPLPRVTTPRQLPVRITQMLNDRSAA